MSAAGLATRLGMSAIDSVVEGFWGTMVALKGTDIAHAGFQEALGHSPLDHLHGLRCQRARVLLELSLDGVPAIGEACGYADPAAFRRVFRRETGVSPAQYRQRYALRSPRVRWKVDAT